MPTLSAALRHTFDRDPEREIQIIQKYWQLLHAIAHDCTTVPCAHYVPARYTGGTAR